MTEAEIIKVYEANIRALQKYAKNESMDDAEYICLATVILIMRGDPSSGTSALCQNSLDQDIFCFTACTGPTALNAFAQAGVIGSERRP